MQLPNVVPLDGTSIDNTLRQLTDVRNKIANIGSGSWNEVLVDFQRWAAQSADSLGYCFDQADVERLITTRRHWWLMEQMPTRESREIGPVIHESFRAEQTDRKRVLDKLIETYNSIETRWRGFKGKVLIADTNVFIHNDKYWNEVDWSDLAGDGDIRLMIPSVVLRELDTHKRSARNSKVSDTNNESLRDRARKSSRRVRASFVRADSVVQLGEGSNCFAELLLDDIDHVRNSDTDSEIIERALDLQSLIPRPVTIVTGDGNMQFQAEVAGLQVINVYESGH